MALPASHIFEQVVRDTNDLTSVRWSMPELAGYFNDGQRDIAANRPDAVNTRVTYPLVAGTRQTLPAGGEKLISVNHNATGTKSVVTKINRNLLDDQLRGWRTATGSTEILHYMYDPREPRVFEVYPPALGTGTSVDLEYVALPTDIAIPAPGTLAAAAAGAMTISDLFANALVNYILYRCYRKDTEYAANPGRAAAYYQAYINDLGTEVKATAAVAPVTAT